MRQIDAIFGMRRYPSEQCQADQLIKVRSLRLLMYRSFRAQQIMVASTQQQQALPQCAIDALYDFIKIIEEIRSSSSKEEWAAFCQQDEGLAQWRRLLREDPFTNHGLVKPRGYPGDATLMDYAYGHPSIKPSVEQSTPIGQYIYKATFSTIGSISARMRIDFISREIGYLLQSKEGVVIASYASGHGREIEHLGDKASDLRLMYAVDSDAQSLAELARITEGKVATLAINKNVLRLKRNDIVNVDLAYSLGLFDYLNFDAARLVLNKMATAVAPGGKIIVGNIADNAGNLGYCEAVTDWWMISRTSKEMEELGAVLLKLGRWTFEVTRVECFHYLVGHHHAPP